MNLFPTQLEELILRTPALAPHFQCVLTRSGRLDELTVRVERRLAASSTDIPPAAAALRQSIKDSIGVTVAVEVLEPDGVERSLGKARRIVDARPKSR